MIQGLLMGLLGVIILLSTSYIKKMIWKSKGNSVATISSVKSIEEHKSGTIIKRKWYMVEYNTDLEYNGEPVQSTIRVSVDSEEDIEKNIGKRLNGYYNPKIGKYTFIGFISEDTATSDAVSDVKQDDQITEMIGQDEIQKNVEAKDDLREEKNQENNSLFCRECGTKLSPDAVFCPECGTKVFVQLTKEEQLESHDVTLNEADIPSIPMNKMEESEDEALTNDTQGISKHDSIDLSQLTAELPPVLRRAFILVEDGEWEKADGYFEKVLDEEPENAYAYLGKLLVKSRISEIDDLKNLPGLANNKLYVRTIKYADEDLKRVLLSIERGV